MKLRFTELVDRYPYPLKVKSELSLYFSKLFEFGCNHYDGTRDFKRRLIHAFNVTTNWMNNYCVSLMFKEPIRLSNFYNVPHSENLESILGEYYIRESDIEWDIDIVESDYAECYIDLREWESSNSESVDNSVETVNNLKEVTESSVETILNPTPLEDLSIKGPPVPFFDVNSIYREGIVNGNHYVIYRSLPLIPTKQCEVTLTTEVDSMSESDLMNLYPNVKLQVRNELFNERIDGLDYDEFVGSFIKIDGFSRDQLIDNIIKYPLIEFLEREGKSNREPKWVDFWKFIEIDGQLHKTTDVWDSLKDTRGLPKTKPIIAEYVIRRYLLERDVKHIDHNYKPWGTLDKFLVLYMPCDMYIKHGYKNVVDIARQCVESRVSRIMSRNPIIRRLNESA